MQITTDTQHCTVLLPMFHCAHNTLYIQDEGALGQVFLPAFQYFLLTIIPPLFHTHFQSTQLYTNLATDRITT